MTGTDSSREHDHSRSGLPRFHGLPLDLLRELNVVVLSGLSLSGHDARIRAGIFRKARDWGWVVEDAGHHGEDLKAFLRHSGRAADGVIAHVASRELKETLEATGLPVVDLCGLVKHSFPCVAPDFKPMGTLAAEHFLEKGYRNFVYFSVGTSRYESERWQGYSERLEQEGLQAVWVHSDKKGDPPSSVISEFGFYNWPGHFPKPLAVFCSTDSQAARALNLCSLLGIGVPDQVALLGVDDVHSISRIQHPPLSSIRGPSEQMGETAAEWLQALMSGAACPENPPEYEVPLLLQRQSTSVFAIADSRIRQALEFMRTHLGVEHRVDEAAVAAGMSRRALENAFRDQLSSSPLKEWTRMRLDAACHLLATQWLHIPLVAEYSGFATAESMTKAFRRHLNTTPSAYRKLHQNKGK